MVLIVEKAVLPSQVVAMEMVVYVMVHLAAQVLFVKFLMDNHCACVRKD
jgi:hypothetical protein